MIAAKLVRAHIKRAGPDLDCAIVVTYLWRTKGGEEWDGRREFPTLQTAIDTVNWLYACERAYA